VEVTQSSGDHGIDILAEKDDITYAIQCKCYTSSIGNSAIQQAHTGKSYYKKDIAVVLTNQYFTQQAIEEAKEIGVKLWDRDKLNEMLGEEK
jgi:restriction system protein